MRVIVNDNDTEIQIESINFNKICSITGLEKEEIRAKFNKPNYYKLFHDSVYDFFEILFPEGPSKKTDRKYFFCKKCFLNLIYFKKFTIYNINRNVIESKYKEYIPTSYEYFLKKCNGDVDLAKKLHKNRQANTSLESFIKKYGDIRGPIEFKNHFDKLHNNITGDKHWMRRLEIPLKEHYSKIKNIPLDKINDYISGKLSLINKGLSEEEIVQWFRDKAIKSYRPKTAEELEIWKKSIKLNIENLKITGEFYNKFGCWKVCYEYACKHNIEYTDENRKDIWNILFQSHDIRYWLNRGFSLEDSRKQISKIFKHKSKISISCFSEIMAYCNIFIETEIPIETFIVDGFIQKNNIIIEFYGDYWHANPTIYAQDHKIRGGKTAEEIWRSDAYKKQYLTDLGYKVFIIWESEWRSNKDIILEQFKNLLNE